MSGGLDGDNDAVVDGQDILLLCIRELAAGSSPSELESAIHVVKLRIMTKNKYFCNTFLMSVMIYIYIHINL